MTHKTLAVDSSCFRHLYRLFVLLGFCGIGHLAYAQILPSQQPTRMGDCPGQDTYCSAGPMPTNNYCGPSTLGHTAVCWDNRPSGYPPGLAANCAPSAVWCTYKSVPVGQCSGGQAPGRMYKCSQQGWQTVVPEARVQTPQSDEMIVAHEFHVTESGNSAIKTIKEMGTDEFAYIVRAACIYYSGSDCPQANAHVRKGSEVAGTIVEGTNVFITGQVTEHGSGSEEWRGIFDSPKGLEPCWAGLDKLSITGPSTFNTVILRGSPNGLGFYAVIPKHRKTRQWVNAYFFVKYVPIGTAEERGCMKAKQNPWICKGQNCNPIEKVGSLDVVGD